MQVSGQPTAEKSLTVDEMNSEALAIILGSHRVWSAGTYWEPNAFSNQTLFAPFSYKENVFRRRLKLDDLARLNASEEVYTNKVWYRELKKRWSTQNIEQFLSKINIRDTKAIDCSFVVSDLESGYWTPIHYDCEGPIKRWLNTYAVPFFGWDKQNVSLEFK